MAPDQQLLELLKLLIDRFGAHRSLGEVYATSYALEGFREGRILSISEIADATDCSKQNLSRWLQYQIDIGQAATQPNDEDGRVQEIGITDPMWAYRHLESIAKMFDCEADPPKQSGKTNQFQPTNGKAQ